jgi:hypothetical protein
MAKLKGIKIKNAFMIVKLFIYQQKVKKNWIE